MDSGRFDHLEIGDLPPVHPDKPALDVVIDQNYYLEKASGAFADEDYEKALTYYSRALEYDLNLEEAWVGQIRCLIHLGELQEAIIWSEQALERFPNGADVLSARAVAEARLRRTENAIGFSDAALATRGGTAYVWIARGDVMIPVNLTNARACFMKAVELAPADWRIRAWIGHAYLAHGAMHQALEQFQLAAKLDPQQHACWFRIGQCCEALADMDQARIAYQRALACKPGYQEAREALRHMSARGPIADFFARLIASFRRHKEV